VLVASEFDIRNYYGYYLPYYLKHYYQIAYNANAS